VHHFHHTMEMVSAIVSFREPDTFGVLCGGDRAVRGYFRSTMRVRLAEFARASTGVRLVLACIVHMRKPNRFAIMYGYKLIVIYNEPGYLRTCLLR
jgi:hypothetical protein